MKLIFSFFQIQIKTMERHNLINQVGKINAIGYPFFAYNITSKGHESINQLKQGQTSKLMLPGKVANPLLETTSFSNLMVC